MWFHGSDDSEAKSRLGIKWKNPNVLEIQESVQSDDDIGLYL